MRKPQATRASGGERRARGGGPGQGRALAPCGWGRQPMAQFVVNSPRAAAIPLPGTGHRGAGVGSASRGGASKEVGAPARGIGVAPGANALTPRGQTSSRYLGPRSTTTAPAIVTERGPRVEGAAWAWVPPCPTVRSAPGGCADRTGRSGWPPRRRSGRGSSRGGRGRPVRWAPSGCQPRRNQPTTRLRPDDQREGSGTTEQRQPA